MGSYPDEHSGRYEIGNYVTFYNTERPHQALWNFTPATVHELNNNTLLLAKLEELKYGGVSPNPRKFRDPGWRYNFPRPLILKPAP